MRDRNVFPHVSAFLKNYLRRLVVLCAPGPLPAMRELIHGVVFTGSVQLITATLLVSADPSRLHRVLDRLSGHLAERWWNHHERGTVVLQLRAEEMEADGLISLDPAEPARPCARRRNSGWPCLPTPLARTIAGRSGRRV